MTTRHESARVGRLATATVVAALLLTAARLGAQDTVTVATVTVDLAPGAVVAVPISLRDSSGTPLGGDQGVGATIQMISLTVELAPSAPVSGVDLDRAGASASPSPVFEHDVSSGNRQSLVVAFDEGTAPLLLSLDGSVPGDQVAVAHVTLSSTVAITDVIALDLVAATTALADDSGLSSESQTGGSLVLVSGAIIGSGLFADGFESGAFAAWSGASP